MNSPLAGLSVGAREKLAEFDVNGDGNLDPNEISQIVDTLANEQFRGRHLKYGFLALALVVVVLIGCMFGISWAVFLANKDTEVQQGVWVTRADKLPIQLGNSQMTVVDGMLCSRDASNATVSTQPNTVQRPLSANMTTAQLTSLTRVYLSSSTYRLVAGSPPTLLLSTPSGSLEVSGNSISGHRWPGGGHGDGLAGGNGHLHEIMAPIYQPASTCRTGFDSNGRSAIAAAVGHLPTKVRPRHAHRIKHGLELEKELVWVWRGMLIGLGIFFAFLAAITLGLIYAVGFASKNTVVENSTLVTRGTQAPVQVGNSAFTVDSRNMLVATHPGNSSNTTVPLLVQTTTVQTLKLLSSNMTASELQSVRKVYLKSTDGTELALKVTSCTLREDSSAPGRGLRVALLSTPSGMLQLRGEAVSVVAPGAGGVLLQQDGSPMAGLAGPASTTTARASIITGPYQHLFFRRRAAGKVEAAHVAG
eukprot:XP_001702913.1 predicted protein [Chlamydomonas reinhardtii]